MSDKLLLQWTANGGLSPKGDLLPGLESTLGNYPSLIARMAFKVCLGIHSLSLSLQYLSQNNPFKAFISFSSFQSGLLRLSILWQCFRDSSPKEPHQGSFQNSSDFLSGCWSSELSHLNSGTAKSFLNAVQMSLSPLMFPPPSKLRA